MAYYDALVAKWGTLSGTTAQKLAAVNALMVTGSVPTLFRVSGSAILDCLNFAEFNALTAAQQSTLLQICAMPGLLLGGSASPLVGPMFVSYYAGKLAGPTITALTALAQGAVVPWWQSSVANGGGGLAGPVSAGDLVAAGNLT